ncbi:hypothetical protein SAMN04487914_13928 [Arthrobacter sp. ok909]|uniref:protealysin inhibitor emfourin n=1 Tax=Arthrobacter sp. ok909 TaxID=1761746 RepID=UPI000888E2D3|nr:protealysin inhibitor emfourin [Arthrobacter sp. ok909]SDP78422.1 hypothetical protein SAMN04487914_13928 [Arthrobacter sp. ok909]
MDELHVSYQRSGGIAGITMAAEAAEPDLPDDVALIAVSLLGGASDMGIRPFSPAEEANSQALPAPGADQFTYELEVSRGSESQTFRWSDTTMPDQVRPLVYSLAQRSQPIRQA